MIKTVGVRDIAACAAFFGMAYAWLQPLSCVVGFFGLCCANGLSGQSLSSFFRPGLVVWRPSYNRMTAATHILWRPSHARTAAVVSSA